LSNPFPNPRRSHREWSIDVLRAAAVLLVIGHHGGYAGDGLPQPLALAMRVWNRSGWIGVDLFFVLSGFLVSGLLFREWQLHGRLQAGRFLARRGLKIYPAFYAYLLIAIAARLMTGAVVVPGTVLSEALFVQNYGSRFLIHTWSLAVEEHFYLLLTAAFVWARERVLNLRLVVMAFAAVACGVLAGRCVTWGLTHSTDAVLYMTHSRIDALSAGVALACLYHVRPATFAAAARRWLALLALAAALLMPAVVLRNTHAFMLTVGLTTTYAGFVALLLVAVGNFQEEKPPAPAAVLAWIGKYSYSIYLWHLPVRVALIWLAERGLGVASGGPAFGIYLLLSLAVGIGLARIVEIPGLMLRDRWFPSRTGAPTVTVEPSSVR
jgi:peptidoglycan/LPS O-acetylase OafA/YrhL